MHWLTCCSQDTWTHAIIKYIGTWGSHLISSRYVICAPVAGRALRDQLLRDLSHVLWAQQLTVVEQRVSGYGGKEVVLTFF